MSFERSIKPSVLDMENTNEMEGRLLCDQGVVLDTNSEECSFRNSDGRANSPYVAESVVAVGKPQQPCSVSQQDSRDQELEPGFPHLLTAGPVPLTPRRQNRLQVMGSPISNRKKSCPQSPRRESPQWREATGTDGLEDSDDSDSVLDGVHKGETSPCPNRRAAAGILAATPRCPDKRVVVNRCVRMLLLCAAYALFCYSRCSEQSAHKNHFMENNISSNISQSLTDVTPDQDYPSVVESRASSKKHVHSNHSFSKEEVESLPRFTMPPQRLNNSAHFYSPEHRTVRPDLPKFYLRKHQNQQNKKQPLLLQASSSFEQPILFQRTASKDHPIHVDYHGFSLLTKIVLILLALDTLFREIKLWMRTRQQFQHQRRL